MNILALMPLLKKNSKITINNSQYPSIIEAIGEHEYKVTTSLWCVNGDIIQIFITIKEYDGVYEITMSDNGNTLENNCSNVNIKKICNNLNISIINIEDSNNIELYKILSISKKDNLMDFVINFALDLVRIDAIINLN